MTVTLATLTAAVLEPLVGQTLELTLPDGRTTTGVLASVKERAPQPGLARTPFSFLFRAPDDGAHPSQGTVRIAHASFGALEVFAVPVGRGPDGISWEVIFS